MKQAAFGEDNPHLSPREQLLRGVIDAIAQTMDLYGANYSFGQLYGIMFFEDKPMTLEEMKQVMNMSKSNMSYGVRSLIASRMVTKLDEKRERKDLYAAETDFFQAFKNFFTLKLQREIDVMQQAMGSAMPELQALIDAADTPEEEREACLRDLDKLRHAVEYYAWLQRFVSGLEEGELFGGAGLPGRE
ncbi:transcriptional regulator [Paenibacillus helianthi]|uniref:HTH-type transcriptional regulator n=1 Tax=Paenibacillus helianthi TaxID=1349432 RepID=A0ABX3ERY3_9BACL|nr:MULTISPECIES: transcriptional regulator [Paenibacillus]OKP89589.1 transcriptional regulator [Paenibacillus helianthi]OKP93720.1 transcriptional regulator [Paenibacillus sp. P32E]